MSSSEFFDDLVSILEERGFRGFESERDPNGPVTLHEAIRIAVVGVDDPKSPGDVAYWEWRTLRPFLNGVWKNLDRALTELYPPNRSTIAWCYPAERSMAEVRPLLNHARQFELPLRPTATRRPTPKDLVRSGKLIGSIVEGLAVLHEATGSSYGDILEATVAKLSGSSSDVDLLRVVDDACVASGADLGKTDDETRVPRALIRAYLKEARDAEEAGDALKFLDFLRAESGLNNLAGLSDVALLRRLAAIEPEQMGTPADKKVKKILGAA